MSKKTMRCVICYHEFSDEEAVEATCCPNCGSKSVLCNLADDVTIKINWHELRILGCWAERWALQIENQAMGSVATLDCIAQRLQKQYPNKTPLTLRAEVTQLQQTYPDVKLTDGEGNPIE